MPIADEAWKTIEEQRKRQEPGLRQIKPRPKNFDSNVILTTVGRCIFNDILPKAMPFYNYALTAKGSQPRDRRHATPQLGRPATIKLLDDMKSLGFKRSTLAGLSFGITDIRSPDTKATILDDGQKKADRSKRHYRMGAITDQERYAQLIDLWGHARKQVTEDLMAGLANDYRDDEGKPVARQDRAARSSISTPSP